MLTKTECASIRDTLDDLGSALADLGFRWPNDLKRSYDRSIRTINQALGNEHEDEETD